MRIARWLVAALSAAALGPAAASAASADWIVAVAGEPPARELAAASGAHEVNRVLGIWTAPEPAAHRLAARLRAHGVLRFEEPDRPILPAAVPPGGAALHDAAAAAWWRPKILGTAGEVPLGPAGPAAAPVAVIEAGGFDASHPDIPPSVTLRRAPGVPDPAHGTAVVSLIAGRGPGVLGVNPGSDVRVYGGLPVCSDMAHAIRQAVKDGARVVTTAYTFSGRSVCLAHEVATTYASRTALVVAPVARTGARLAQPANDPHVLTVMAIDVQDRPTPSGAATAAVDLAAPGEGIGVSCPIAGDTLDGITDGVCLGSGTSLAAPIVAAVAARLMAARPALSTNQIAHLLEFTATDIGVRDYDFTTGWGAVSISGALSGRTPRNDTGEPNDDIEWVDGRRFARDAPLLRHRTRASVFAGIDFGKDPIDVYPVWLGPHERLRVTARPRFASVILGAHGSGARSLYRWRQRFITDTEVRPGGSGSITVVNGQARGETIWVSVHLPPDQVAATYDLAFRRR